MCDLFKEMEGRGGGGSGGLEGGAGIVAMVMTRNVHVNGSLAISPHRLMGPKPRPVPSLSVTDSKDPNVIWNAGGIRSA